MEGREWRFALTISGAHGVDHLLKRVFPPLVPIWAVAFGFPLWKLGLLLGARSLGSALGQAPMGHLSDRFDRRVMLPAGIAVIGVSFLAFATLPGLDALDVRLAVVAGTPVTGQFIAMTLAMVAVGLGSSTLHPVGYPLISRNVGAERQGKVLGMWGSARAFGDGGAPAVVGVALLVTGWETILAGFGLLGVAYAGYLFVVLGAFDTQPGEETGDASAATTGLLGGDRRRFLYPMLAVFAAFTLQIVATTGANVFLPEFVATEYGYSFSLAGVDVIPEATASFYYSALLLTAAVVQLGTGELVDRYDDRTVLVGFLLAATVVLLTLAVGQFSAPALLAVLLLLGASLWGLNPARDAIVADIAPAAHEGRTFGYLWTGALLVASLSPAVVGYLGDVVGLRVAFTVLAGVVLLSTIPVAALLSTRVYLDDEPLAPAD